MFILVISDDVGKVSEDDITYSDLQILHHQQKPIRWSRGSVLCAVSICKVYIYF